MVKVLDIVSAIENPEPPWFKEQAAMMNVMDRDGSQSHFKWVPQRTMNAYPDFICPTQNPALSEQYHYKKGDFVIHFPTCSTAEWFPNSLKTEWLPKVTGK